MLKIKDELFIDIKGYDGRYKIGNKGTIIGISRSNDNRYKNKQWILKQYEDRKGYMYVTLQRKKRRKTIKVHRLVAEHFIENKNNYPCVNHIDSNRKNNDVSNLEFCTHKQNTQWALKTGRFDNMKKLNSERMKGNKLNGYIYANEITKKKIIQCDLDDNFIKEYQSISEASRQTGITITGISYCANGIRKSGGGYLWRFV